MAKFSRLKATLLVACITGLAACEPAQMAETTNMAMTEKNSQASPGISYFLPKAVIEISVKGAMTSGKLEDAATAMTIDVPRGGGASGSKASSPSATATATAAPKISIDMAGTHSHPSSDTNKPASLIYKLSVTASTPVLVPDAKQEYFLHYHPDRWADDTIGLHVGSDGLLKSAAGESVDQRAAAAAALIQFASTAASAVFGPPGGAKPFQEKGLRPEKQKKQAPLVCLLPPAARSIEYEPVAKLVDGQKEAEQFYIVDAGDQYIQLTISSRPLAENWAGGTGTTHGVMFRDWSIWEVKLKVHFSDVAAAACSLKDSTVAYDVLIPQDGHEFRVDMSRAALVDKQTTLTVQNGMLVGVDIKNPSFYFALAKLPLTFLQALLSPLTSTVSGAAPATAAAPVAAVAAKPSGN